LHRFPEDRRQDKGSCTRRKRLRGKASRIRGIRPGCWGYLGTLDDSSIEFHCSGLGDGSWDTPTLAGIVPGTEKSPSERRESVRADVRGCRHPEGPRADGEAAGLQVEVVGRSRRIDELRIASQVRSNSATARIEYRPGCPEDKVVVDQAG